MQEIRESCFVLKNLKKALSDNNQSSHNFIFVVFMTFF